MTECHYFNGLIRSFLLHTFCARRTVEWPKQSICSLHLVSVLLQTSCHVEAAVYMVKSDNVFSVVLTDQVSWVKPGLPLCQIDKQSDSSAWPESQLDETCEDDAGE